MGNFKFNILANQIISLKVYSVCQFQCEKLLAYTNRYLSLICSKDSIKIENFDFSNHETFVKRFEKIFFHKNDFLIFSPKHFVYIFKRDRDGESVIASFEFL